MIAAKLARRRGYRIAGSMHMIQSARGTPPPEPPTLPPPPPWLHGCRGAAWRGMRRHAHPEPKPEPNPKPRPNPNQVALLATQAVGVLVRAAEQPVEELRLGGLLLGCGLLLLALRMGKPLGGGLAEEDSAQP